MNGLLLTDAGRRVGWAVRRAGHSDATVGLPCDSVRMPCCARLVTSVLPGCLLASPSRAAELSAYELRAGALVLRVSTSETAQLFLEPGRPGGVLHTKAVVADDEAAAGLYLLSPVFSQYPSSMQSPKVDGHETSAHEMHFSEQSGQAINIDG